MAQSTPSVTVVIPAHNEAAGLRRLLPRLLEGYAPGDIRVLVICNGCTDDSADAARLYGPDVEAIEVPDASKARALVVGGTLTTAFPIAFIDADVSVTGSSLRTLVARLADSPLLAVAPARRLERQGVSPAAGCYYDIWERLPGVRSGLFARGVIVLSESGYQRVRGMPQYISDDLAFSEAFRPRERGICVDATVSVWPARTWSALLQRRQRVIRGNNELRAAARISSEASTGVRDLIGIVAAEPLMLLRLPFFLAMTVAARRAERRLPPGSSVWLRDESSRTS